MVSRIILCVLLFFLGLQLLFSQSAIFPKKQWMIYGQLRDSTTDQPIAFGNIEIRHHGGRIANVGANREGRFEIAVDAGIKVKLRISAVGYSKRELDLVDTSGQRRAVDLGIISLAGGRRLETVQIIKRLPVIENKIDKIVYNVANDPGLIGSTGDDVFRKLPMVSIGYDGKVSLKGNQQVKILLNGKPSAVFNSHSGDALRLLSSHQIKSVEIMTNPSAKYDMEGGGGVINIVTNKRLIDGVNGGVTGAIETRRSNISGHIAGRLGTFGLTASIGSSWNYPIESSIQSEGFTVSGERLFSQINQSRNRRNGKQFTMAVDYDLDSNNVLVTNFNFNGLTIATNNDIESIYQKDNVVSTGQVESKQPAENLDISTDYIRKLGSPGRELALSVQYLKVDNSLAYASLYNSRSELGTNRGRSHEYTAQIDLKYPIKSMTIEAGVKMLKRNIQALVELDTMVVEGNFTRDVQQSYLFTYRQDVLAGYATVGFPMGKLFTTQVGLRLEQADLFPNLTFAYNHAKIGTFKMVYAKRIQRPSLYYLNPFLNRTDRVSHMQGNPDLKSEIIHQLEVGGDFNLNKNKVRMGFSIYCRTKNNMIEQVYQPSAQDNQMITLQTFGNIGQNRSFGTNINGSCNLFNRLDLSANIDIYTYSNVIAKEFWNATVAQDKVSLLYKTYLGVTIVMGKGYTCNSYILFDSPQKTFQGAFAAFNLWNITFKKKVFKETGSIGFMMTDPFSKVKNLKSYAQSPNLTFNSNFSMPFRSFGMSLSWSFGLKKDHLYRTKERRVNNQDLKL